MNGPLSNCLTSPVQSQIDSIIPSQHNIMSPKHVLTKVQKIGSQIDDIDLTPSTNELDNGSRKDFGNRTNSIGDKDTPLRLGVLELSTRACKVLVVDVRSLQNGFNWSAVQNKSYITELGRLLDPDNFIVWIE